GGYGNIDLLAPQGSITVVAVQNFNPVSGTTNVVADNFNLGGLPFQLSLTTSSGDLNLFVNSMDLFVAQLRANGPGASINIVGPSTINSHNANIYASNNLNIGSSI